MCHPISRTRRHLPGPGPPRRPGRQLEVELPRPAPHFCLVLPLAVHVSGLSLGNFLRRGPAAHVGAATVCQSKRSLAPHPSEMKICWRTILKRSLCAHALHLSHAPHILTCCYNSHMLSFYTVYNYDDRCAQPWDLAPKLEAASSRSSVSSRRSAHLCCAQSGLARSTPGP